jgi:hypothetical protein
MRNQSIVCAALLAAAGCGEARIVSDSQPIIVAPFYVDQTGQPIGATTADAMTIQKVAGSAKVPVMAPDGHAVTWGEFRAASGTATLSCEDGGTRVHVQLAHLIPNGVYTGQLVFFEAPGFKSQLFNALSGVAPVGPSDGSQSKLIANASGAATLEALVPAGNVTVTIPGKTQAVPSCLLDAYEVHVVAAYHLDGQTCGATPCAPDKQAEQIGWMFYQGRVQTL